MFFSDSIMNISTFIDSPDPNHGINDLFPDAALSTLEYLENPTDVQGGDPLLGGSSVAVVNGEFEHDLFSFW